MKTIALAMVAALCFVAATPKEKNTNLENAIAKKQLAATFTGNEGSTHYTKPLLAQLKNSSNQTLHIKVPVGTHFKSEERDVQDIVITQEELIALAPNESKTIPLWGMCIQQSNAAPRPKNAFAHNGLASEKLAKTAALVGKTNRQNYQGQAAMWLTASGGSLQNLVGQNTKNEFEFINQIAAICGKPAMPKSTYDKVLKSYAGFVPSAELHGTFVMNFARPLKVHIALFDDNGIVLKQIYNKTVPKGKTKIEYTFDAMPYQGETLHAKLVARGDVLLHRVIAL